MGRLSGYRYRDVTKRLKLFGVAFDRQAVAARKDVTFWKRFMPPLPRLLEGLFQGLLMVH